jgi:hypothetical protein
MVQQQAIMMHVRELPQDSAEGNEEQLKTRHMGGLLSQFMIRQRNKFGKISIIKMTIFSTKKRFTAMTIYKSHILKILQM